ncbi:MAG: S41 family peptidase [Bacteroidia bacterium]|nr:S41 family peptidase [Bacteroidia bacterium]MDW8133748.1 S41 family peptidase [Bacteroidia bacterium]
MKHLRWLGWMGLGVMVGFGIFLLGFRERSDSPNEPHIDDLRKLQLILELVEKYYYRPITQEELVRKAIDGLFRGLDPHSFYIPKEIQQQEEAEMSGGFEGIGIEFQIIEDTIQVLSPIKGGPSEMVGIQAGDKIIEVDGRVVAGRGITQREVIQLLRGKKGTRVRVKIARPDEKELLEFEIIRDRIPIHAVHFAGKVGEVGYIQLARFSESSHEELRQALRQLKQLGVKGIVLDLRSNPGGYLHMAQRIADEFLPEGKKIVYTQGRVPESNSSYIATSYYGTYEKGPLIIMIGPGSASASEIVAGAVQDWDRGLIVGQRSFGKGVVQTQRYLPDSSAVRITFSRYFTPSGRCIQKPFENVSSEEYEKELKERLERGEFVDETKIPMPDSLKYSTASGRIVYGGGGIIPDIFFPMDTTARRIHPCAQLAQRKNLYFLAAQMYVSRHSEIKNKYNSAEDFAEKFKVDSELWDIFMRKVKEKEINCDFRSDTARRDAEWLLRASVAKLSFGEEARTRVEMERDTDLKRALRLIPAAEELEMTGKLDKARYKAAILKIE